MKIIGKNRWEAINWVQGALGPATPRNVAEDTFGVLLREGLIEDDIDEVVLIEEIEQSELRDKARHTMVKADMRRLGDARHRPNMRRGGPSVHHARGSQMRHHRHAPISYANADGDRSHSTQAPSGAQNNHQRPKQHVLLQQLTDDTMADSETPNANSAPPSSSPTPKKKRP